MFHTYKCSQFRHQHLGQQSDATQCEFFASLPFLHIHIFPQQRISHGGVLLIVSPREHHELTCGSIRIRPAGISFSKSPIWIRTDKFPRVTCLSGSGTCISQVTRSVRVPVSICGYPCKYLQVSAVTCRYNLWYRWLATIVHFNIPTSHSSSLISPSSESTTVTSLSFSSLAFKRRHLSLKTWMISFSGMSPGILLHALRTVDARVDSSDSLCRSLLTVSPPREKPRSTSHEDAKN